MSVRLFAMTCGWLEMGLGLLADGESQQVVVPVPAFLIQHPRGTVVFDSGLHLEMQQDAKERLGPLARAFGVRFHPGEELAARLGALDVDPEAVRWLVTSHLHFDHVGGNAQLPNARWVLQRREWDAAQDDEIRARNFYEPRDYDLGHERQLVDGEHDLFGDGSVSCLPTFGHTAGHQSLRVRLARGDVVLTADACYLRRTLEALHLPPSMHDREAMLASIHRLRALRDGGARIIFGHDPEAWMDVPQAPAEIL
jgi:glyoxylase-like metal-dependent hydrolase (beta-lactamase superfamily II)